MRRAAQALIVDEAHRLKSSSSKLNLALSELKVFHTVLLTGTPLQNNTDELWSLLNFLDSDNFGCRPPRSFLLVPFLLSCVALSIYPSTYRFAIPVLMLSACGRSAADFKRDFGDLKEPAQVVRLQETLAPYMLRRLKSDVEKNIPAKEETIVEVELTVLQRHTCVRAAWTVLQA